MATKGALKFIKDGEIIPIFSDTYLDELKITDAEKFRYQIQANAAETFCFDESEKVHWTKIGSPTITSANSKWGKALQCSSGNYIQSKEKIFIGGRDFTIDLWVYINSSSANQTNIFALDNDLKLEKGSSLNVRWGTIGGSVSTTSGYNYLLHFELCYQQSSGKLYPFINGALGYTRDHAVSRGIRTIILGGATCAISEFRILDGVCLHTSNFSVPTEKYSADYRTVNLLQF